MLANQRLAKKLLNKFVFLILLLTFIFPITSKAEDAKTAESNNLAQNEQLAKIDKNKGAQMPVNAPNGNEQKDAQNSGQKTATKGIVDPISAVLWPAGALISAKETLLPVTMNGETTSYLILPENAQNFFVQVKGATLIRWSSSPCLLPNKGRLARERAVGKENLNKMLEERTATKAALDAWLSRKVELTAANMEAFVEQMQAKILALTAKLNELEQKIKLAQAVESSRPSLSDKGQKITLWLAGAAASVEVSYTYTLSDCWWRPRYAFDAVTATSDTAQDIIKVRLEAEVRQNSGIDWEKTAISLALRESTAVAPNPLANWRIAAPISSAKKNVEARGAAPMAMMAMEDANMSLEATPVAKVARMAVIDTSGENTLWHINAPGLAQGETTLLILEDQWKANLTHLARPSTSRNASVWLMAKANLPTTNVWPAGQANFSLDSVPAGQAFFKADADSATLFFGVDPRVTLSVIPNMEKRGEKGLINKQRQWSWEWSYILHNTRENAVNVRVERPQAQIIDKEVKVEYKNSPEASMDDKDKSLFWEIKVEAQSEAKIQHAITIISPSDKNIYPVAP